MIRSRRHEFGPPRYVSMGHGEQTVVFLHGLFGSPDHWREIMSELEPSYRMIAPQLPVDHQPGRRGRGIQSLEELTDFVRDLLFDLDLPPFVLCGNSLGGLVAIELCLRYPEQITGLVLAGSAGLYERSLTHGVKPTVTREFVRGVISDIFHDPQRLTDELVDEWYRAIHDRDFVRFILRVSRATRDRTLTDELQRLDLPTMIVWGKNDKVTPPDVAESFRSQIKNSELHFIDDCGHAPNVEQPTVFSELLQRFLPSCFCSQRINECASRVTRDVPG